MCVFEEKLDDTTLGRIQDFELAVSSYILETITIWLMTLLGQLHISSACV